MCIRDSLGSNGPSPGVSIWGCDGSRWLTGANAKKLQPGTGSFKKAKDKIFDDENEIVQSGAWLVLPKITKVDLDTFRIRPKLVLYSKQGANYGYTAKTVRIGRLHYDGDPPKPFSMKDGKAPPPPPGKPGHVDGPTTPVRG